jgi:PAS domain S-box-containing protein
MNSSSQPRILVVDDEEAILETMTFTFQDDYEVLTALDAARALDLMDHHASIAAVITDQRMPDCTGVELLKQIHARSPETVRILLTGFSDSEDTIRAINDGHVYAYISKPWDQDELRRIVGQAVELYQLASENRRLLGDLQDANSLLEAMMDQLEVGAIATDEVGIIRAANRPVRAYLDLSSELNGKLLSEVLAGTTHGALVEALKRLTDDPQIHFEDHDLSQNGKGKGHRVRVSTQPLADPTGESLGRVVLFKEISHEPHRRRFDEILGVLDQSGDGSLREPLERALTSLADFAGEVGASGVSSPSMAELAERVSRTQTAMQNWLDVDDAIARDDYPDAQGLLDRMRVANSRWPRAGELPQRVQDLASRVEAYYESGENDRQRVL